MKTFQEFMTESIKSTEAKGSKKNTFLKNNLGNLEFTFENLVYDIAKKQSKDYKGGNWNFYNLSNGSFYMSPISKDNFNVITQIDDLELSPDAFGVGVTIMALNVLLSKLTNNKDTYKSIIKKYDGLFDYAKQLSEKKLIAKMID